MGQVVFKLRVLCGALPRIEHSHLFRDDVNGQNLVVLRQQDGVGNADEANASDGNLH